MKLFRTLLLGLLVAVAAPLIGTAPQLDQSGLVSVAHATALSDGAENCILDWYMRGQTCTPPATQYLGLTTDTCSDASSGTEPSSGAYARVAVASSMANWAGTQSAGSTTASTGNNGTTSNNAAITFPTSTGAWASSATLQAVRSYSASSGGSQNWCINLTSGIAVTASGFTLSFSAGSLTLQIDN